MLKDPSYVAPVEKGCSSCKRLEGELKHQTKCWSNAVQREEETQVKAERLADALENLMGHFKQQCIPDLHEINFSQSSVNVNPTSY